METSKTRTGTARALMELVERLPDAFEQVAVVLEQRAGQGTIQMDTSEDLAVAATGAVRELRAAGTDAQALAYRLAKPAGVLLSLVHQA